VPTTRRSRTIAAPAGDLWSVLADPHHLPRWWPRVTRVEDVREDAFTEVLRTDRGKVVRADFRVRARDDAAHRLVWEQLVQGTPFERVLSTAETEMSLAPAADAARGTEVTIELRQTLSRGAGGTAAPGSGSKLFGSLVPRVGGVMVRRAAARTLEEALDGLERIGG
jgi:uncharacterized protein YndB with AHSA1/START domain